MQIENKIHLYISFLEKSFQSKNTGNKNNINTIIEIIL
jgi:hypothetical protein